MAKMVGGTGEGVTHSEATELAFFPRMGDSESSGVGERLRQRVAVLTRNSW